MLLLFWTLYAVPGFCLQPEEVLVIANQEMAGSVDLARYYMKKRKVPTENFLSLSLTVNETMSRDEYDRVLKKNVLALLHTFPPDNKIAALVLMFGVPLKVAPPNPDGRQPPEMAKLQDSDKRAAVDSELALVQAGKYELAGWQKNPYFLGFHGEKELLSKDQVLLVSRLDGPDTATVYRIINDSLQTEKIGLRGKAYFDARWSESKEKSCQGTKCMTSPSITLLKL